jgi:hypothetical protein
LNPAFDGTGTLNDWVAIVGGFANPPPGLDLRGRLPPTLAVPPRGNRPERKPPFPPPVAKKRATIRKGRTTPHPSHVKAAAAEEEAARFIHTLPGEVVLFWGKVIGTQRGDVISYNLQTRIVTLWDSKWRGTPVRIQPSKTFKKDSDSLSQSLEEAKAAIEASRLSETHKRAAIKSINERTFQTRTLGAGQAKNSTFGDHR